MQEIRTYYKQEIRRYKREREDGTLMSKPWVSSWPTTVPIAPKLRAALYAA